MSFIEEILPVIDMEDFGGKGRIFSDFFVEKLSLSMLNTNCNSSSFELDTCRDESSALTFKFIAIASILVVGVIGIGIPLMGKNLRFLRTDGNLFIGAKAFAAGVILATGFVHMLPDATSALTNPCLPVTPWLKFPFSGFFTMLAALATLVVDFVGTQYYESKHEKTIVANQVMGVDESDGELGIVVVEDKYNQEKEGGGMHIVGIHAHAAHHGHNHAHGEDSYDEGAHAHGHSHGFGDDDDSGVRHIVVSQILELGIVSHSVIIGLSLGVSQSSCTIRPLIAALSFHQFFEGFALGGCISQAQYKTLSATLMAFFFAVTTPIGISIGIGISSFYNANSPRALVIEGTLDSMSAGILVYMALVDLIAADFLSKRMRSNVRLQVVSYFALFLGALMMSSLAIWA